MSESTTRSDDIKAGIAEGLEMAAQYHDRLADTFDQHSWYFGEGFAEVHRRCAQRIREMKP